MRKLLPLLLLAGCATSQPTWYHPTNSETQFNQDFAACQNQAMASTGNSPYLQSTAVLQQQAMIHVTCMRAKGYTRK